MSGVLVWLQDSVAERSCSLLDRVKMYVKPMAQPILCRSRELQEKTRNTQGLEDFTIPSSIRNDRRSSTSKLCKGQRLTRLVSETGTPYG